MHEKILIFFLKLFDMLLTHGIFDKFNSGVPGQNGIRVKCQRFWPKNDDEKLSRKNIFEIPPCAHHVIFITEFALLIKIQ